VSSPWFELCARRGSGLQQQHERTVDALTGVHIYDFGYDGAGHLTSIADRNGNTTQIQRDSNGRATAIVGPYGATTMLSPDDHGNPTSITNPFGATTTLEYGPGDLLTKLVDPRANVHTFEYDSEGHLTKDSSPAGGSVALDANREGTHTSVTVATASGRTSQYGLSATSTDTVERRSLVDASGAASEWVEGSDRSLVAHYPDGSSESVVTGADPRWGMQAPVVTAHRFTTPAGLNYSASTTRKATLQNPDDLASLQALEETLIINGVAFRQSYDATSRRWTLTSPTGRTTGIALDEKGRIAGLTVPSTADTTFTYDDRGRLATTTQSDRVYVQAYGPTGDLARITDPLGRKAQFDRDTAGRITKATLPDGHAIAFGYNASDDLTSVTPPGRPAHSFDYTPIDLVASYSPPPLGMSSPTTYNWNTDRQLEKTNLPDGTSIDLAYQPGGRLATLKTEARSNMYTYRDSTGRIASIASSDGETLSFTYDGPLVTNTSWTGPIAGSTAVTYDNNLRIVQRTVNGANPVMYAYDNDGLLTQAGALTLTRDAGNGRVTSSAVSGVATHHAYNAYGELSHFDAGTIYAFDLERDLSGRIIQKTETIQGTTTLYQYGFDDAGRLVEVITNGQVTSQYTYDPNGNRLMEMEGLPQEAIEAQQRARINHLETEIQTFKNNIDRLSGGD
jgi:YD repeat-containing protein